MSSSDRSSLDRELSVEFGDKVGPPMANGEIVFTEPWQGRIFGMAVALSEAGVFTWPEFQQSLIAAIGKWDIQAQAEAPYEYYEHFANALDQLMEVKGFVSNIELDARASEYAARPHGHDHHH